jgi:3-deoxy-D-manno-octulosonate 8-phosphate phosphatase (KDO 8-P phosphatase)
MHVPGLGTSFLPLRELRKRTARIKLIVLDVDGVLTDGGLYFGPEGEVMKRFDTRDGQGISNARRAGLEVAFLTREATPFTKARADKLKLTHVIVGAQDKPAELLKLYAAVGVTKEQVLYMGDDTWDIPCAPHVGLFFTPSDGWLTKTDGVHVVTERGGGRGAVRQAINFVLAAQKPS